MPLQPADTRARPALVSAGLILASALAVVGAWFAGQGRGIGWALLPAGVLAVLLAVRRADRVGRAAGARVVAAEERVAQRDQLLTCLHRVSSDMVSGADLPQVLDRIVEVCAELLETDGALIGLVVEEGRFVRIEAARGIAAEARGRLIPVDSSMLGWVVSREEPLTSTDLETDPRNFRISELSLQTMAGVPLSAAGIVIGVLAVFNRRDNRSFDDRDVHLLETLADQTVVGIERAHVLEESQRKEAALATKNRQLQHATRLKDQFLANMSHELRTPLNAINGFSDLLLTEELGPLNPTQREFLDSVLRNGQHLLELINSILDLSKIEAGRMTLTLAPTDLHAVIDGAVAGTASLRTAKRQSCKLELGAEPLLAQVDGGRIRQILYNLLSNASKFTPDGGEVTVSAIATRAPLPFPSDRAGDAPRLMARDAVWISVRDTGIGIRPEDMGRLFQEFSQVDSSASRAQQGTGLGLALSRRFVEMHGGTIGCESVYGAGTSLWFLLPVEGPFRRPSGEMGSPAVSAPRPAA
ncbi:MAG: GAF domain-containing sensor histidine kinase [Gemmatimonadota bacterium]|nr:GAF domain-containing sensor histidine kinase [Gemmatimonadota bacterium]MDH4347334.1 GAF domain-containing sensor histidine kinase [Gemmatimonadota bacterium]MDH5282546.1 GAF domain-containing sensor histidine kinase [Gemmatimonadota bacterium]